MAPWISTWVFTSIVTSTGTSTSTSTITSTILSTIAETTSAIWQPPLSTSLRSSFLPSVVPPTVTSQTTAATTSTSPVSNTIYTVLTDTISPRPTTLSTTITQHFVETLTVAYGQTVTVTTPPTITETRTTKLSPTDGSIVISTLTATEVDFVFQNYEGNAFTTVTLATVLPAQVTPNPDAPGSYVLVAHEPGGSGWNDWSAGEKAGLIVGVVLAALLLLWALLWCFRSRNDWIAHDWRWARAVEAGASPGANIVPTVQVPGNAVTPHNAGWNGYGQHPGWGFLRGGDGGDRWSDSVIGKWKYRRAASAHDQPPLMRTVPEDRPNDSKPNQPPARPAFYIPPVSQD